MIDRKIFELINKEVDGIISPEEKTRLHAYLETSPEAQKIYQEQIQTAHLLNKIPSIEPPPDIKKRIMNSIDLNRYPAKKRRPMFESLFSRRSSKWVPRVAFAFGLGLILGLLLHMAFLRDSNQYDWMDNRDFIGTIGMHEREAFRKLDQIPIDLLRVEGEITLSQTSNYLGCEVNLRPMDEFELLVKFSPVTIQFQGFKPSSRSRIVLDNGEDYIKAVHSEEVRYVLFFYRKSSAPTQIDITLHQKGDVKFHREIHLDPIREKE